MDRVRTQPTGRRALLVTRHAPTDSEDDVLDAWWKHFFDYLKPRVNDFDILYRDEYAGLVTTRLLPKLACVGWVEEDRGRLAVLNPVCVHRVHRFCTSAAKLGEVGLAVLTCTDGVRVACAAQGRHYLPKYSEPLVENFVHITKMGPLKNFGGGYD